MNYNKFMATVPLKADIIDDITYLQKHLRLIIKYHQKLSAKLYMKSHQGLKNMTNRSKNFYVVRKLMDEFEKEMEDISREQKTLTDIVKKNLIDYEKSLRQKQNFELDRDLANGFITRAIQYNYEKNYFVIAPSNVKKRMTESILESKFQEVLKHCDEQEDEEIPHKSMVKRESLLKQQFRKPTSTNGQKRPQIEMVKSGRVKKNESRSSKSGDGITCGRMNLLRALKRVKTEDDDKVLRSDEEFSEKSSSFDGNEDVEPTQFRRGRKRKSPTGIHSEESSDSGDYMKYYPNLPDEPPEKEEYDQIEFLGIFHLITPETLAKLKMRRTERKRRTCTKNQKNDFHYGNFDLNEAAYRVRLNNKKSLLYSTLQSSKKK